jgi:hypothetical protein
MAARWSSVTTAPCSLVAKYGNAAIMTRMGANDLEHPDAVAEAEAIGKEQIAGYDEALGEMIEVVSFLLPMANRTARRAEDLMYEETNAPIGTRLFSRQFHGSNGASVVAVVAVKGGRTALLALAPVGLSVNNAPAFCYTQALTHALAQACSRSVGM